MYIDLMQFFYIGFEGSVEIDFNNLVIIFEIVEIHANALFNS